MSRSSAGHRRETMTLEKVMPRAGGPAAPVAPPARAVISPGSQKRRSNSLVRQEQRTAVFLAVPAGDRGYRGDHCAPLFMPVG